MSAWLAREGEWMVKLTEGEGVPYGLYIYVGIEGWKGMSSEGMGMEW